MNLPSPRNLILFLIILILLFLSFSNFLTMRNKCGGANNEEKIEKLELKIKELKNILIMEHQENTKEGNKEKKKEKQKIQENIQPIKPVVKKEKIRKNEKEMKKLVSTLKYHPSNFIIGIIAANRPHYLKKLFESLERVEYWNKNNTILFQYGNGEEVSNMCKSMGIREIKNPVIHQYNNVHLTEGAQHISLHYKFTLTKLFRELYPQVEHVILVEDDMILSPDFLLYFSQVAPHLNHPEVYAISA
jgi:hypothetical protein